MTPHPLEESNQTYVGKGFMLLITGGYLVPRKPGTYAPREFLEDVSSAKLCTIAPIAGRVPYELNA